VPTGTVSFTLDGTKYPEGAHVKKLGFGGTGGARQVTLTVTTGSPPNIGNAGEDCTPSPTCSKQIRLERPSAGANPCTNPGGWQYAVTVADDSQLASVKAIATRKVGDAAATQENRDLKNGGTSGPPGIWTSDLMTPELAKGTTLTFTIEAVDQFGYSSKGPAQTIVCPP